MGPGGAIRGVGGDDETQRGGTGRAPPIWGAHPPPPKSSTHPPRFCTATPPIAPQLSPAPLGGSLDIGGSVCAGGPGHIGAPPIPPRGEAITRCPPIAGGGTDPKIAFFFFLGGSPVSAHCTVALGLGSPFIGGGTAGGGAMVLGGPMGGSDPHFKWGGGSGLACAPPVRRGLCSSGMGGLSVGGSHCGGGRAFIFVRGGVFCKYCE